MPRWLNPNMWTANYQELTVDQTKRASDGMGISLLTCYINGPISFSLCGLQCFLQDPQALPQHVLMSFGDCVYLLAFLRQVNCCAHPRPDRCKCWWSESLKKFGGDPRTPMKAHTHTHTLSLQKKPVVTPDSETHEVVSNMVAWESGQEVLASKALNQMLNFTLYH